MNLIDENDRLFAGVAQPIRGRGHDAAHFRDVAFHAAQPNKLRLRHLSDDLRERCFSCSRRTGQDHGRQSIGFDRSPQ
jgi:hypothetical protein